MKHIANRRGLLHKRPETKRSRTLWASILAGALFLPMEAWAQTAQLPAPQNAGLLTPLSGPAQTNLPGAGFPSSVMDEIRLEAPDDVNPEIRLEAPAFMVRQIVVEGATLFPEETLHALVAPYEGREQTLEVLNTAAAEISKLYHDKGYLTAQAYIPPQEMPGGVLTIRVQEGRVGSVTLEGAQYYKASILRQRDLLSQEPGALFNVRVLEEELNRSNRLNEGYRLRAILTAGEVPGQTDIKLRVAERHPLQISPTFDNQGRPYIGMYRAGVEVKHDSLLGRGDRLYTRWVNGSGTQIGMASYSIPINRFGTELSANFGYSNIDLDLGGENPPSISGRALTYGVGITQPLDKNRHWVADGGLTMRRVSDFFENNRTNFNDIRAFHVGVTYNKYDRWGRTYNRTQGATALSGLGGNSQFFKLENYFTRIIVMPKRNMLFLKAYSQWSPSVLPVAESFQLGGYNSVRGFTEGVLLGDKGFSAGIEHRFPIPGMHKLSPWVDDRLQASLFYDVGRVWQNSGNTLYAGRSNGIASSLLQSVGFGFRAQISRYLQGFMDVGFALSGKNLETLGTQPTARIHVGIRTDVIPNDYRVRNADKVPLMARPLPLSTDPVPNLTKAARAD